MLARIRKNLRLGYYQKYLMTRLLKPMDKENSWNPEEITWNKIYRDDYWSSHHPKCSVRWLHELNKIRVPLMYEAYFMPNALNEHNLEPKKEFKNVKILDVGCGGGICSEALAALNFNVVGIDPDPYMIAIAKNHAIPTKAYITKQLQYFNTTIEDFHKDNAEKFDGVVISEVIERLPLSKKEAFLQKCVSCCKIDGNIWMTSRGISFRTIQQLLFFIMNKGPDEIYHHSLFYGIGPHRLDEMLERCGCTTRAVRGIRYVYFEDTFVRDEEYHAWFFLHATRRRLILQ